MPTVNLTMVSAAGITITPIPGTSVQTAGVQISISAVDGTASFKSWQITGSGSIADANSRSTTATLTGDATIAVTVQKDD
jgi:hypothetical protein